MFKFKKCLLHHLQGSVKGGESWMNPMTRQFSNMGLMVGIALITENMLIFINTCSILAVECEIVKLIELVVL